MNTYSKLTVLSTASALLLMVTFSSCVVDETETFSYYIIDNQSSYQLTYRDQNNGGSFENRIIPGEEIEIDDTSELGTEGRTPDEFFKNKRNAVNEDIYLYRDSSRVEIKALKLNSSGVLNWVETLRGKNGDGNLFNYTLLVTDSMVK